MAHPVIELVAKVFAPLGEERQRQILSWVANEWNTRAIVAYFDTGVRPDGTTVYWKLGEPSPLDGNCVVFAMLHLEADDTMVVYSVRFSEDGDGDTGAQYFEEKIRHPKAVQGPISGDALYLQLATLIAPAQATAPAKEDEEEDEEDDEEDKAPPAAGPRPAVPKKRPAQTAPPTTNGGSSS